MNLKLTKLAVVVLSLSTYMLPVEAGQTTSERSATSTTNSQITQSGKKHQEWGISEAEYARYEELMKGVRGAISPDNISPIEVLGIHAKTDAERNKYAKLWADIMEKDAERVLKFQAAYNAAWEAKGSPDIIDMSKIKSRNKRQSVTANKPVKYILFTNLGGCEQCSQKLNGALNTLMLSPNATLEVNFADSKGKGAGVVRSWAQQNNLNTEWLKTKRVVLRHGSNMLSHYKLTADDMPALFSVNDQGRAKRVQ